MQNPRDGGAWWAAVYGVTQSRTRLKRLSISSSSRNGNEESMSYKNVYIYLRQFSRWLFMINDVHIATKNGFLVTFARVHFSDTSSKIVLDRKLMPVWRPSVSTISPVPSRKKVFFHSDWTPSKHENDRTESKSQQESSNSSVSFFSTIKKLLLHSKCRPPGSGDSPI